MARDSDNAAALVDGIVSVAPKGTTLPITVTAALAVGFADLGWLTDAGIGETPSTSTNVKRGINGTTIKTIKTAADTSFTFECYERNAVTLGLIRPGSVGVTTAGLTITPVKAFLGSNEKAFVLEQNFGTWTRRAAIARGEAFLTNAVQDKPGDLAVLQFRIDCYPDTAGVKYIDLTNNPAEAIGA